MSLVLIKKYPLDNEGKKPAIQIMAYLTEQETRLLAEFFVLDDVLLKDDKQRLILLCRSIYERDYWVQCDCITGDEKPVFRFNRAVTGKLYLHHITSRGNHGVDCVFKERERSAQTTSQKCDRSHLKKASSLNLMAKKSFDVVAINKTPGADAIRSHSGTRRSSLCRALYRLLDDAGLNVIHTGKTLPAFKALELAASTIDLQPKKRLLDYLYTNPAMLFKIAYALKSDNSPWPPSISKHALMLVKARAFDKQKIEAILPNGTTQIIPVSHHIYPSSGRLGRRAAPFMALILITDSPEKPQFYQPVKAYIVPCYSEKTFIPVDSHYERKMLRRLYALQFEQAKKGRQLEIIKPLFDIPVFQGTPDETYVLPDFIVKTNNKTLIIEVNGSHEKDYLLRKTRQHQHMGALGQVLSFDAYGAEKEGHFNQTINQFMAQIKTHINDSAN